MQNKAREILEAEFDADGDPELIAAREAAKIIKAGKDLKMKLARERLRSVMSVRSPDEIADGHSSRPRPEPVEETLAEVIQHPSSRGTGTRETGKDSVPSGGGGSETPTLDINVYPPDENLNVNVGSEPDNLTYALSYAAAGYAVFPCHTPSESSGCSCAHGGPCKAKGRPKPSKHPRTLRGVKDATKDPEKIRYRWGCGRTRISGLLRANLRALTRWTSTPPTAVPSQLPR